MYTLPPKPRDYIIKYKALNSAGQVIKEGKMRAKKKATDFEAMAGLEKHFTEKLPGFDRLVVIYITPEDEVEQLAQMMVNMSNVFKP